MTLTPLSISAITLSLLLLIIAILLFIIPRIRTLHSLRFRKLASNTNTNTSLSRYHIAEAEGVEFQDRLPFSCSKVCGEKRGWMESGRSGVVSGQRGGDKGERKSEGKGGVMEGGKAEKGLPIRVSSRRGIVFTERGSSIIGSGMEVIVPEKTYYPPALPISSLLDPSPVPVPPKASPSPATNRDLTPDSPYKAKTLTPEPLKLNTATVHPEIPAHQHSISVPSPTYFSSPSSPTTISTKTTMTVDRANTQKVVNHSSSLQGKERDDHSGEGNKREERRREKETENFRGARSGWVDIRGGKVGLGEEEKHRNGKGEGGRF